ncbi:MAG: GntR family transcriptional regulator [Blastocatellia bacterium AA13]|nr:MAG: GntR family transcriptional regulator [Blastocatellia bacterium AA13]
MMSFNIKAEHPMPLHHQLERAIRFGIATGKLTIGDQLPTVRSLAVDLKINANTVAKVYAELERTGILETRRGVGTFVKARHFEAAKDRDRERELREVEDHFLAEAAHLGFSAKEAIEHMKNRLQKEK